ncbi:MAG: hypothetical protein H7230_00480 [Candidatus Parcubacteria bacterium]|nr:hypothetical protein [Candidatus Paceibacterota bacterium]
MSNPNSTLSDDQVDQDASLPTVSPAMARLKALRVSSAQKPLLPIEPILQPFTSLEALPEDDFFGNTTQPSPVSTATPVPPSPIEAPVEDQVDWESLFLEATAKKNPPQIASPNLSPPPEFQDQVPLPIVSAPTLNVDDSDDSPVEEFPSFLPPINQDDIFQSGLNQRISQALPDISIPQLEDSSEFFVPPFEIFEPKFVPITAVASVSTPLPKLVDQIQLKPEINANIPDLDKLEITQSDGRYPLTLTEDPTQPNPITQMLKKLQGQFGTQIKQSMTAVRARLAITMASFNNKTGDASNLEASLFQK